VGFLEASSTFKRSDLLHKEDIMEDYGLYSGTIIAARPTFAFIGRNTTKKFMEFEDDGRHRTIEAPFTGDIFVHQDDCPVKLKVGQRFRFRVVPDQARKGMFRATNLHYAGSKFRSIAEEAAMALWVAFFMAIFAGLFTIDEPQSVVEGVALALMAFVGGLACSILLMRLAKAVFGWGFSVSDLYH
jgi:hypothetical protein